MLGEGVGGGWFARLGNTEYPSLRVSNENKELRLGSARDFKSNLSSVRQEEGEGRFRYMEVQVGKKIAWLAQGRTGLGASGRTVQRTFSKFSVIKFNLLASLL
jgi:hypothetical protein